MNKSRPSQIGAALLAAMLTVTLVATFAASALWRQFRSVEVEAAERSRVQSGWILTGAQDWARLILREDAKAGGADYLSEPWAVPLSEARLSSFLAAGQDAGETDRNAFLSGQISDLQARLNVANLVEGNTVSESGLASFTRLFELLGLPAQELTTLANQMVMASQSASPQTAQGVLLPQHVDQLIWLGISPQVLAKLRPFITLLPQRTPVNINTASAEVLHASTPGLELSSAQKLVAVRERSHFRTVGDASQQVAGSAGQFDTNRHSVTTRFFEVRGRLRLDQTVVEERSIMQRDEATVRTLWRDRSVVTNLPVPASPPSS